MIELHAIWQTDFGTRPVLYVWSTGHKSRQFFRRQTMSPPMHPYCQRPVDTVHILRQLSGEIYDGPETPDGQVRLWLPKEPHHPLSSEDTSVFLKPWHVTGVFLEMPALWSILQGAYRQSALVAPGVRLGADLRYWATVAHWVSIVLSQGYVLPDVPEHPNLRYQDGVMLSLWRLPEIPTIDADLRRLAEAMPPVCVTSGLDQVTSAPEDTWEIRRELVDGFVGAFVDGTVRQWIEDPALIGGHSDPIVQRWVASLHERDGDFEVPAPAWTQFHGQLREWHAQPVIETDKPAMHLRLQLEPVVPKDAAIPVIAEQWRMQYWLEDSADPTLLLAASDIWNQSGEEGRRLQNHLLGQLAAVAPLCAAIATSLAVNEPCGCELDAQAVRAFVTHTARALQDERGVSVRWPSWLGHAVHDANVTVRVQSRHDSSGQLTMDSLLDYDWQASIGDAEIDPDTFRQLARMKVPVLRIRDQWVELRPEQLERILKLWDDTGPTSVTDLAWRRLASEDEAVDVTLDSQDAAANKIRSFVDLLGSNAQFEPLPPPKGLLATLRPYQLRGFGWLAFMRKLRFGACLADDMGLGKTLQTLALVLYEKSQGDAAKPALVICPTSVVDNWHREAERFAPSLTTHIHYGPDRLSNNEFAEAVDDVDMVITSYALAHRDAAILKQVDWGILTLDEAQHIKNPQAKRTRSIRTLSAEYRLALTGTPMENRLTELWSIMDFCNPGYLGTLDDFRTRFSRPIEKHGDEDRLKLVRSLVRPFILRRAKVDPEIAPDLPDKLEAKIFCSLTSEQASLYEATVQDMLDQISDADGMQRRGLVFSALTRLKQICDHPALFMKEAHGAIVRSGKLMQLVTMLSQHLGKHDRALIFTQYAKMGHLLQRELEAIAGEVLFLHGGTPKTKRDEMVRRFQDDDGPFLFILSLRAGGLGLNLTRATHVFHFDRWWNPAVENQATDRAFRIGQERDVHVHKLICTGTLEERIDEMIEAKRALADSVVEGGEKWISELSTAELHEVFALRRQAVRAP